jgi:hypothetical protein
MQDPDDPKPTIIVKQTVRDAEYDGTLLDLVPILEHTVVVNLATHDPQVDPVESTLDTAAFGGCVIAEVRSAPSATEQRDAARLQARVAGLQAMWPGTAPTIVPAFLCNGDLRDFDGFPVTVSAWIAGRGRWNSQQEGCETFGEARAGLAGFIGSSEENRWVLDAIQHFRVEQTMLTLRRCGFQLDTGRVRLRGSMAGPHVLTRPEGGAIVVYGGCDFRLCDWPDGTSTISRLNGPLWRTPPERIATSDARDASKLGASLWTLLEEEVDR